MATTPSQMVALGKTMPSFSLPDAVSGKFYSDKDLEEFNAVVIIFICNHCPYVKHVNQQLVRLAMDYSSRLIAFFAISSNDILQFPEDGFSQMKDTALKIGYPFPYLYDESQETARAFDAACTPDFFVFDRNRKLVYRGQLDDSRPSNDIPVTGKDIRAALICLLENRPVSSEQRPSIGCNIKWKM